MRARLILLTLLGLLTQGKGAALAQAPAPVERPTVMVLYFDNRSGDAELDPLGKGLADMIMTDLSTMPELQVVERARLEKLLKELQLQRSSFFDPQTAQRLGRGAGAQYAVLGAAAAAGRTLRIDVRVVRVESGEIVKAGQVSGGRQQFFDLQQQLAARLMEGLAPALRLSAGRAAQAQREARERRENRAPDLGAALLYGQALGAQDQGDGALAAQLLGQLAQQAPGFQLGRVRYLESLKALALQAAPPVPSPAEQQAQAACRAVMASQLLCGPGGPPPGPAQTPSPAAPSSGAFAQRARGGALELGLGAALAATEVRNSDSPALRAGLFGGYKLGRFIFGLGLDLSHLRSGGTVEGTPGGGGVTSFLLGPGLRVAALRLGGDKAELVAVADLLYGYGSDGAHRVVFDAGPALRYWLHDRIAMGLLGALRGDFLVAGQRGGAALGFAAALQVLGVL